MISHEGMLLIYILFIYILHIYFITLFICYICTYILTLWQTCFWSWLLIALLLLKVWQSFFLFLILLFTFWRKYSEKTLRALMMAPECLVWTIVLLSPPVDSIILGGGHELMQHCAWWTFHYSIHQALWQSHRVHGCYTSDQCIYQYTSLSHAALFALNSVYGDVNVAVLIYFHLYLYNVIHLSWPSVFMRHCF